MTKVVAQDSKPSGEPQGVCHIEQHAHRGEGGPVKPAHQLPGADGKLVLAGEFLRVRPRDALAVASIEEGDQFFASASSVLACASIIPKSLSEIACQRWGRSPTHSR